MQTAIKAIQAFMTKYSPVLHTALTFWNLFVVGWATGGAVPLTEFGIPYSINPRDIVSYIQLHTHLPTWIVGVFTFAVNATIAYSSWKKTHDIPSKS